LLLAAGLVLSGDFPSLRLLIPGLSTQTPTPQGEEAVLELPTPFDAEFQPFEPLEVEYGGSEVEPAPAGEVNDPPLGTYVYELRGTTETEGSAPVSFSSQQQTTVSRVLGTTSRRPLGPYPALTTRESLRRGDWRIEVVSFEDLIELAEYRCAFNPPLPVIPVSPRAHRVPIRPLRGAGNLCNGSFDSVVAAQRSVQDAGGRSWNTWEVRTRFHANTDGYWVTEWQTRYYSPHLGVDVRTKVARMYQIEDDPTVTVQHEAVLASWP
jgi:hypothetical protein